MKTNKFDDAIRRKLESIEPPFRERDWLHMQTFMHRHGYPAPWAAVSQWLVPLAAAAAVTGLIISTLWLFRINHELSQSLQTLGQTVARLETIQAKLIKNQTLRDTVYVLNSTNPLPTRPGQPTISYNESRSATTRPEERYAQQLAKPVGYPRRSSGAGTQRELSTDRTAPVRPTPANQLAQPTNSTQSGDGSPVNSIASPAGPTGRPATGQPADPNETKSNRALSQSVQARPQTDPATGQLNGRDPLGTGPAVSRPLNDKLVAALTDAATKSADSRGVVERSAMTSLPVASETTVRSTEAINRLDNRPIVVDPAYFAEGLAKRTRRIRSVIPATVVLQSANTAPTEATLSRPARSGIRLRVGASGEISRGQRGMGAYTELLIGNYWSVGAGLNRISSQGDQFEDDYQFKRETKNDFRKMYAPRIDPKHSIVDIDRQFALWQVPVSVSYRALLGRGFVLVPSVGMDFSLSVQDNTTFTYRRGPSESDKYPNVRGLSQSPPRQWFNDYTVAFGAEKTWKRVVLQAGPVLSVPTRALADPVNPVLLSLRTRVLFEF